MLFVVPLAALYECFLSACAHVCACVYVSDVVCVCVCVSVCVCVCVCVCRSGV